MLRTESKTIGDFTYKVNQLGAGEGRRCLVRLAKTLGPVLSALMVDVKPKAATGGRTFSVLDVSGEAVAKALTELSDNINAEDLDYFCSTFGTKTMVVKPDGKEAQLTLEAQEIHFAGRYGDLFRWLAFCMEVNYRDFFADIGTWTGGKAGGGESISSK